IPGTPVVWSIFSEAKRNTPDEWYAQLSTNGPVDGMNRNGACLLSTAIWYVTPATAVKCRPLAPPIVVRLFGKPLKGWMKRYSRPRKDVGGRTKPLVSSMPPNGTLVEEALYPYSFCWPIAPDPASAGVG